MSHQRDVWVLFLVEAPTPNLSHPLTGGAAILSAPSRWVLHVSAERSLSPPGVFLSSLDRAHPLQILKLQVRRLVRTLSALERRCLPLERGAPYISL